MRHSPALILVLLCAVRQATAALNLFPLNDAVVADEGSTVVLRCGSDKPVGPLPNARMLWTEFATTDLGSVVSDNRNLVPGHPHVARYSVIGNDADNEYSLEIRDVTLADGGLYLCQDVQAFPPEIFRGYAELVVLATPPSCTTYATGGGIVIEGQTYSADCEVRYQGNLAPDMEWFGPTGFFVQNGTKPPNSVWSYMAFIAVIEIDAQVFFHRTDFSVPTVMPGYATNAPNYTHTVFGPALDVSWPPRSMQVAPIRPSYAVGEQITCTADSKPPANFQWQNMRTLDHAPLGPVFTIMPDLEGFEQVMRCTASVIIEGGYHSSDIFANVSVPLPTTTPEPTTTPTTTPPPADGPCQLLSGRWTATNPSSTICMDVDTKGNVFVIIRNGTDLFFVGGRGKTVYNDYRHIGFTAQWSSTGVGGFSGECHSCYGTEVILMSGLYRNKHAHDVCGESEGTHVTNLLVFTRSGPICLGMEVDEVRTQHPWIVERLGVKAKKITTF